MQAKEGLLQSKVDLKDFNTIIVRFYQINDSFDLSFRFSNMARAAKSPSFNMERSFSKCKVENSTSFNGLNAQTSLPVKRSKSRYKASPAPYSNLDSMKNSQTNENKKITFNTEFRIVKLKNVKNLKVKNGVKTKDPDSKLSSNQQSLRIKSSCKNNRKLSMKNVSRSQEFSSKIRKYKTMRSNLDTLSKKNIYKKERCITPCFNNKRPKVGGNC